MIAPRLTTTCPKCGVKSSVTLDSCGQWLSSPHKCAGAGASIPTGDAVKRPDLSRRTKYRATPTTRDGIRFASKTEAALYDMAKREPGAVVIPHVRFPLHAITTAGEPCAWFTPDLLVLRLDLSGERWAVECYEAKGPRALESRDYALRARAFKATYKDIPLRVWRKQRGELVED